MRSGIRVEGGVVDELVHDSLHGCFCEFVAVRHADGVVVLDAQQTR